MITDEHKIALLADFEKEIEGVIALFQKKYGTKTPHKLWIDGKIERVGFLDENKNIEYSLNLSGCGVEFNGQKDISYDIDSSGIFLYGSYNFLMYLESIEFTNVFPNEKAIYIFFNNLRKKGIFFLATDGRGRLNRNKWNPKVK